MPEMSSPSGSNPRPAVFLSYAREDGELTRRIAEALRASGVEVWFDENELRGGDAWDRAIRKQIRDCALFLPVISANTQARLEGYFRLEWKLAEDRSHLMARGKPFIVPVCIDGTPERDALVPDAFLAVQWTRLAGGDGTATASFAERVKRLLAGEGAPVAGQQTGDLAKSPAVTADHLHIPDFELLRKIGSGSYGDVWLARGLTGVYRAVKIVWRNRFANAEPFEREFRGLREFSAHSLEASQMALLHVGQVERAGFFYYVMELADDAVTGRVIDPARYVPLTAKELKARRGRLPAGDCVAFGVELARSLSGLHAHRLLHRDIKPSNVIIVGGVPKLADIGLVASSTDARTFVGTEGYVPPEGPGAPSADVFALGKVLYELATGLDRTEFPKLPDELGEPREQRALFELNEILLRACAVAPTSRYHDGAALLADLSALQAGRSLRQRRAGRRLNRNLLACGAVVLVVGIVAATKYFKSRPPPLPPAPALALASTAEAESIAVLPFANLSTEKDSEYFSDGLTEEILNALARERSLRVVGRTSSFSFKGKNASATDVGRALSVTRLVEGSVQRAGGRVRIRVQLTRTADGISEALGSFDREMKDIFALQDEVAHAVVEKLTHRVATGTVAVLTKNLEAYDAYLRGRVLQVRTALNADEAAKLFERAVELDPGFATAWAQLGSARFRNYSAGLDVRPDLLASARAAIERALTLQPELPAALITRAAMRRVVDNDVEAARRDLARAEALQGPTADLRLSQAAMAANAGDWASIGPLALDAMNLDPANGDTANALGLMLNFCGQFAEADRFYQRAMAIAGKEVPTPFVNRVSMRLRWRGASAVIQLLDRTPSDRVGLRSLRATALRNLGQIAEARALRETVYKEVAAASASHGEPPAPIASFPPDLLDALGEHDLALRRAEEIRKNAQAQLDRGNRRPSSRGSLIGAEIALGHAASAVAALEAWRQETQNLPSVYRRWYEFGQWALDWYVNLGKFDDAISLLREMMAGGMQPGYLLRDDYHYVPLRGDPRFQALMTQAEAWAAAQPEPPDEPALAPVQPTTAIAPATATNDKSLVVLPLENLSPDPANGFFADGVHAEIILTLSRLADFKVISRNSALAFKDTKESLAAVAQKLGVANLITGTVQRSGDKVRIRLELRRASDEALLWSKAYNGDLKDALAIQTDVADEVMRVLQARERKGGVAGAKFLTKNSAAYDLLLKARDAEDRGPTLANAEAAIGFAEKALQLDPDFMSAAAMLAGAHVAAFRYERDAARRATHAQGAKQWAETASRLMPGGGGDSALSYYFVIIEPDNARSIALAENAVRALPGEAENHNLLAIAYYRAGRAADAVVAYRDAIALDPLDKVTRRNQLNSLARLRRFEAWQQALADYKNVFGVEEPAEVRATQRFQLTGELPTDDASGSQLAQIDWLWRARDFDGVLRAADTLLADPKITDAGRYAPLSRRSEALRRLGQEKAADETAAELLKLVGVLNAQPAIDRAVIDSRLGRALACAGRADEALAANRRYVEALSPDNQVADRWDREIVLATRCAQFGRIRECVELLAKLLRQPSGITVPMLKVAPDWDKVREDPAFQALLVDPNNSAPL